MIRYPDGRDVGAGGCCGMIIYRPCRLNRTIHVQILIVTVVIKTFGN